jgi:hypothetical protein
VKGFVREKTATCLTLGPLYDHNVRNVEFDRPRGVPAGAIARPRSPSVGLDRGVNGKYGAHLQFLETHSAQSAVASGSSAALFD